MTTTTKRTKGCEFCSQKFNRPTGHFECPYCLKEWMRSKAQIKMIVQSPSDKNTTIWLPQAIAWAAARGIAAGTHYAVMLVGREATARFSHDGQSVRVEWKDGNVSNYGPNSQAIIN